jgi:small subunit ribosomal protein S2
MVKKLVEAGVHFGHLMSRWCPKMAPFIWGNRNKVHLIDVSKTAHQLERAAQFLESVAAEGKQVLWVGTKKAAQEAIAQAAKTSHMPSVNHRWIGGTLSNFIQVKKSVTKLAHHEDVIEKAEKMPHYTKKELNVFQKLAQRLDKNVGGIRQLKWPIGAIVIVDVRKEAAALREAVTMGIPVVGLVDTNNDPSLVDYVIPGNDDAPEAIACILEVLGAATARGVETYKQAAAKRGEAARAEKRAKEEATESADALPVPEVAGLAALQDQAEAPASHDKKRSAKKAALEAEGGAPTEKVSSSAKASDFANMPAEARRAKEGAQADKTADGQKPRTFVKKSGPKISKA